MPGYYRERLAGERLKQVYETAPPRIRQYLEAEVRHVLERVHPGETVLELGCGYGRIVPRLARRAGLVVGVDTSLTSLLLGREAISGTPNCCLLNMDAACTGFADGVFDVVVCIQNGISAFHVDPKKLVAESVRIARQNGLVLFSTYSDKFWEDRLAWFRLQAEAGLVGEIDLGQTSNGVIVCKDGFTATTIAPHEFSSLVSGLCVDVHIEEVDQSSVFYEIIPR